MSLTWLETEDGPFIVVPRDALSLWSGTDGDYDWACGVLELVAGISTAEWRKRPC
ncbi:hypothetical protein ACFP3U_16410 [Kitasatospora misakiensis]|uniref:Uncharacterized protein n=1 Tax=Kitasatospora misakiensis TaxID=67330 RepID=A0ABW0X494_9ACTN